MRRSRNSIVKNIIGSLLSYGNCRCGRSWWYAPHNNPGIYNGNGGGTLLCNDCYLDEKEAIDKRNARRYKAEGFVQPRWPGAEDGH